MRYHPVYWLAPTLALLISPSPVSTNPTQRIRSVLDSIAVDLTANNRASLVARYDPKGVVFLGHGGLTFAPFDSLLTTVYGEWWQPPIRFAWRNVTVSTLGPSAAAVYAQFIWHSSAADSSVTSYTGVFRYDGKRWRISSEHESSASDMQSHVNAVGYLLLQRHRAVEAVALFRLNVEMCPDSWNSYDSLGEGLLAIGDTVEAISSYRHSLALNPRNTNATAVLTGLGAAP